MINSDLILYETVKTSVLFELLYFGIVDSSDG